MLQVLRTGALTALSAVALSAVLRAQAPGGHAHTHVAPHGGEVVETASHHVEFKVDPSGAIWVWLLDAQEKTMAPPVGGRVTLIPEGPEAGEQITLPLQVDSAKQRLATQFEATKFKAFQAVVSLSIEGKRHNFRFHYPSHH